MLVHMVFGWRGIAMLAIAAVMIAPGLIPRPLAARMTAAAVLLVGLLFTPGVPLAIFHATDLGRVLWRLSWALPVAALVGTLATALVRSRWALGVRLVPALALTALLVVIGVFPWSDQSARGLVFPPVYKRFPEELRAARAALSAAEPGDLIWAQRKPSQTIGVLSPDLTTVNPRGFFTTALADVPAALVPERKRLHIVIQYGLRSKPGTPAAAAEEASVRRDLDALGVDVACPPRDALGILALLEDGGWHRVSESPEVICFRR
jgi:hypothetical protein